MEYNQQFSSTTPTFAFADPFQRLAAAFIDGIIIAGIHWVLGMILGWAGTGLGSLVGLAYTFTKDALPYTNGKSIGKMLIGIRVVTEREKLPITNNYTASVVRAVSLLIPIFNVIDALMVFSTERKRFGDKWAGTIVIVSKD